MRVSIAMLVLMLAPALSQAQDEPAPEPPEARPWEEGISEQTRAQALQLFSEANAHFAASEYGQARDGYLAALEIWDHPRIHGNLVTALIRLGAAPIVSYAHLRAALRYGAAPFSAEVHAALGDFQTLLEGQLSSVTVRCPDEGVMVRVDGDETFECPAGGTTQIDAGEHMLVAAREGYLTFTEAFTSVGGQETVIEIELTPLADAARFERYWEEWIPWTVFGVGLAVGALGTLPLVGAIDARDRYEAEIERSCSTGCTQSELPDAVTSLADWTETWNAVAWSTFVIGGVAVATGIVLLVLNAERRVDVDESGERLSAVPLVGPDFAGLAVLGSVQ